jgi:uncharacterized protein (TIGR03790 family)
MSVKRTTCSALIAALTALATLLPRLAAAQSGANVLVVVNENSPASIAVAGHYASARQIPVDQVALLRMPADESISYADYVRTIESPLAEWIAKRSLHDKILYIVLTKGVPIRILGTGGIDGTVASVDSELTLLYRRMTGTPVPLPGRPANPYFLADRAVSVAKRFTHLDHDIYLVTRLDGYSVDEVLKLIDRSVAPTKAGQFVLDQRKKLLDMTAGDKWLADAATRLKDAGAGSVTLENTRAVASTAEPVLGYYSWGSNDESNRLRGADLTFAPGALAGMFVSTDGRTFQEPPADWTPGPSKRPPSMFGNGSQSMAADLIREGASGVSAHVDEPYLDATIRPQILFPAYVSGFNLAEAYYLAMPYLSWRTIVIGDPLCAPFRPSALTAAEISRDLNPDTELPALFSERRLAAMSKTGFRKEALQLYLRANARSARGDNRVAETMLGRVRDMEPGFTLARFQLAGMLEKREDYDGAIAEYRAIVERNPADAGALNNLAYGLAVRKGALDEALLFAERAFAVSRTGLVADTLGWIHYLRGDHVAALPLLTQAAVAAPSSAEVQLHLAFIQAVVGQPDKARAALDAALKLDPSFAERDDVKDLKNKIAGSI